MAIIESMGKNNVVVTSGKELSILIYGHANSESNVLSNLRGLIKNNCVKRIGNCRLMVNPEITCRVKNKDNLIRIYRNI
jgi:hypothetical protein